MALKSTIHKANLSVADLDRGHYADYNLTLARHPSENEERLMIRLLAFALHAQEDLGFGKGLSDPDDPDLVVRDLTGSIVHWIEIGQPDERALLRACGRASRVSVLAYASSVPVWWQGLANRLSRTRNLLVQTVPPDASLALAALAERGMNLQVTIQDQSATVHGDKGSVELPVQTLLMPGG